MGRHVGAVDSVHAVKGISFVAHHGQSIGIIGHNGSGKSTLLRAIAGVMPTSGGRIWADGTASLLGVNAALMSKLSGSRKIGRGAGRGRVCQNDLIPVVAVSLKKKKP